MGRGSRCAFDIVIMLRWLGHHSRVIGDGRSSAQVGVKVHVGYVQVDEMGLPLAPAWAHTMFTRLFWVGLLQAFHLLLPKPPSSTSA